MQRLHLQTYLNYCMWLVRCAQLLRPPTRTNFPPLTIFLFALFAIFFMIFLPNSSYAFQFDTEYDTEALKNKAFDLTNLSAFIVHSIAYGFACFAISISLLFCLAIVMAMAVLLLDVFIEVFNSLQTRRERMLREAALQDDSREDGLDTYCDTWNQR